MTDDPARLDPSELLRDGPPDAAATLLLAHGAGAPMDSPFMNAIAAGVAAAGIAVVRFEFPYMAARRRGGKTGAPDRPDVLLARWRHAYATVAAECDTVVVGGKSLGGRMASMVADELGAAGLVCLGYPLHPPGKPATATRIAHLATLHTPAVIVQGERDPFGMPDDVAGVALAPAIEVVWLPDGDHSWHPRKRSGHTDETNLERGVAAVVEFVRRVAG